MAWYGIPPRPLPQVFRGLDFIISNGSRSELERLRFKIMACGGIIRTNFSKAVSYYIVPYGTPTGSPWKDSQAKLFGLRPLDERFIDACIHCGTVVQYWPYMCSIVTPTQNSPPNNNSDDLTEEEQKAVDILAKINLTKQTST